MGRHRKNRHKTLPPNLYEGINGHYKYHRPDNGKWHSLGRDRIKAISAAKQLNSMLMVGRDLVDKVLGNNVIFNKFLEEFESVILPERELAAVTLREYKNQLNHIDKALGDKPIDEISVMDIAEYLKPFSPRASNKYRSLLSLIFKYAVANGLRPDNPADKTLSRKTKKLRRRLTLEGFFAIYNEAEQWLKNAMDIALQTLQRREDIVNIKFSDIKDGYLYVVQSKTKKHGDSAYIRAKITEPLQNVIERCKDRMLTPYIIHRRPDRMNKQNCNAKSKKHVTQITPEYLSKAFSEVRDRLYIFKQMPPAERPTFHEIRALGIKLYKEAGSDPQKLAGHFNSAMTEKYLEGHGIQWTETFAGITVNFDKLPQKTA